MKHHSTLFSRKGLIFGTFILLVSFSTSFGQSKVDRLDELISLATEYRQFNGSVLVADKGGVIYTKGFGMANMEWNIPNASDTKHRLGSITKQFTSMLIMQLVEQGKIKLDAPVSTYLPEYPKPQGETITIHHLLCHTSGIPNYTSFPSFEKDLSREPYSPEEFMSVFADSSLQFNPGDRFSYSNSGYFLLGVILEKVSGVSYEQLLKDHITGPLKMNNTGYDRQDTILSKRASGYEKNGSSYINASFLDMSIPYAAGALYSTVEDLYLWDQALYTDKLLSKENMSLLFQEHVPIGSDFYGYGWSVGEMPIGSTTDSLQAVTHSGGINGFNSFITRIPSTKEVIVLLNNGGGAPLWKMSVAILGILNGKSYDLPKISLAVLLSEVIKEKGIEEGLTQFNKYKDSDTFSLVEGELNNVGYQFLGSNRVKEAIEVFKLNVESFPGSGNVYDSLGEAYLVDGNKELAIINYKKAIELDPKNENGKKILEGLLSK